MGRIKEERRAGRFELCVALRGLRVSNTRSFSFCGKKKKKRKCQYINKVGMYLYQLNGMNSLCVASALR